MDISLRLCGWEGKGNAEGGEMVTRNCGVTCWRLQRQSSSGCNRRKGLSRWNRGKIVKAEEVKGYVLISSDDRRPGEEGRWGQGAREHSESGSWEVGGRQGVRKSETMPVIRRTDPNPTPGAKCINGSCHFRGENLTPRHRRPLWSFISNSPPTTFPQALHSSTELLSVISTCQFFNQECPCLFSLPKWLLLSFQS